MRSLRTRYPGHRRRSPRRDRRPFYRRCMLCGERCRRWLCRFCDLEAL